MRSRPDSAEFGALYVAHFRAVWRTLRRLGVQQGSIDDATQEVFVTAWRRWDEFEGRSTQKTWLLGIALRVASDARRKQRPTEEVSDELPFAQPGPETQAEAKETSRAVERLLSKLEPDRRQLLLLVDGEGYSVPEVAQATGVNMNTLYTRLRVARQQFEELIMAEAGELK